MPNVVASFFKSPDWIWRGLLTLMIAGQYWVQINFLPRAEFIKEKEGAVQNYQEDKRTWWRKLDEITHTLNGMNAAITTATANGETIKDHEQRLRALEYNTHHTPIK